MDPYINCTRTDTTPSSRYNFHPRFLFSVYHAYCRFLHPELYTTKSGMTTSCADCNTEISSVLTDCDYSDVQEDGLALIYIDR